MNEVLRDWFAQKGWTPFDFQKQTWKSYREGKSGLVHAPTGTGKTYAVWLGALGEWLDENAACLAQEKRLSVPLRVLWITPLRALANDTLEALEAPIRELKLPWSLELRTGDTSSSARKRQREKLPSALVTTPESLSLMLSYPETRQALGSLRCVIVDEWHELMGSKRGTQVELALARIRTWIPSVRIWGISATLGNLPQAMQVLVGCEGADRARLVQGKQAKPLQIETLCPDKLEHFPWAGHLGMKLLPQVLEAVEKAKSTLIFTNTRSQTEIWFKAILEARPEWAGEIALHHGSLDRKMRSWIEEQLRQGKMRCVVCTSSLDLGVDFTPVDQILQVGSPKGVGRLVQRAGRSGHQPGATSRIRCVPTQALELVEFSAAREAVERRDIEPRLPVECPLDVLVQHLVTCALGGGFQGEQLWQEVKGTYAFRALTRPQWEWCMDFVTRGGEALQAYSQYSRVVEREGQYVVEDPQIARIHRMSVGTITSEAAIAIRLLRGGNLGTVEESFIARLRPGDRFVFAGLTLELVQVRQMTAFVRKARRPSGFTPKWSGSRFPVSSQLARAVRRRLEEAHRGRFEDAEMRAISPLLKLQEALSRIPRSGELLLEQTRTREGYHTFVYPLEGRLVHEGLGPLLAYRITQLVSCSIGVTANDYGIELLSTAPLKLDHAQWQSMFRPELALEDLTACLNASELARRQFRDIARIAGLVFQGYPGAPKPMRHVQTSTGLLYDVFVRYDPGNLLLEQARREVLENQLEATRLREALERIAGQNLLVVETSQLTPLSFPLWAEAVQAQLSSEKWPERLQRMLEQLELGAAAAFEVA